MTGHRFHITIVAIISTETDCACFIGPVAEESSVTVALQINNKVLDVSQCIERWSGEVVLIQLMRSRRYVFDFFFVNGVSDSDRDDLDSFILCLLGY